MVIDNTIRLSVPIRGMTCAACVIHITNSLETVDGISDITVNLATEKANIRFDPDLAPLKNITDAVEDAGYLVRTDNVQLLVKQVENNHSISSAIQVLEKSHGVISVSTNNNPNHVNITYIQGLFKQTTIQSAFETHGYTVSFINDPSPELQEESHQDFPFAKSKLITSISSAIFIMTCMSVPELTSWLSMDAVWIYFALATIVQFWAASQFYVSSWKALRHRTTNMNTLISVGTSVAYGYSAIATVMGNSAIPELWNSHTYFDTSTTIISLVLLGRYIETRARRKSGDSIRALLDLSPKEAVIIKNGIEQKVEAHQIKPGNVIVIKPGESLPVDGVVIDGNPSIDESILTGESFPVDKKQGNVVTGGTLNTTSPFSYKATRVGTDTVLSRIIEQVDNAQTSKAPSQRFADVVSGYFVPSVIVIALVASAIWVVIGPDPSYVNAILIAVSVLIISCPCALGLATPTAIVVGTGKAALNGVLFKDAATLEITNSIDIIAFDKTGTLTEGYPTVAGIIHENLSENDLMILAASVEKASEHPISTSILQYASEKNLKLKNITEARATPGLGIEASINGSKVYVGNRDFMSQQNFIASDPLQASAETLQKEGKTIIYVGTEGAIHGIIALSDRIRREANDVITKLKNKGMKIVMLTGDTKAVAHTIGSIAGTDLIYSNLLPEDKADIVSTLQKEGHKVMMVGDGINDAISLTQADVGVSIGTGSDVAISSSDVTLIGSDLEGIQVAIDISSKTMLTIKQNLFWAFAYNVALIPVAAGVLYPFFSSGVPSSLNFVLGEFGFLNPIVAATAMAISSITVIANSLRLRKVIN